MSKRFLGAALLTLVAATVALAGPSGPVYALQLNGSGYAPNGSNVSGGGFTAQPLASINNVTYAAWSNAGVSATLPFTTFCLETMASFTPGNSYYTTIDDRIYYANAGASGLALTNGIRGVYATLVQNNYSFSALGLGAFSAADRNMIVQAYIWNQLGYAMPSTAWQSYFNSHTTIINSLNAYANAAGRDNVRVLNLWKSPTDFSAGKDAQSQLFYGPPTDVPLPAAATLGLLGAALTAGRRRQQS